MPSMAEESCECMETARSLEDFFVLGGTVSDAAVKFDMSANSIRRLRTKLQSMGGEYKLENRATGFWRCTKRVFYAAD